MHRSLHRCQTFADFTRDVKPVLARHCVSCHGPDKQRGGLRLDTAAAARQGGNAGPFERT